MNRELTWLEFNRRVLHEGQDPSTPLLERVKFLAIVSSNIDEFFMKRIGGLKQQVETHLTGRTIDGRTASEQIDECFTVVRRLEGQQRATAAALLEEMAEEGIRILYFPELDKSQRKWLRDHYLKNIYPLVTPQATDPDNGRRTRRSTGPIGPDATP